MSRQHMKCTVTFEYEQYPTDFDCQDPEGMAASDQYDMVVGTLLQDLIDEVGKNRLKIRVTPIGDWREKI